VNDDSPHVLFAIDELQEMLTHYEAGGVGRLAALARARRLSLFCINQQRVQLGAKLSEVLRTNAGAEVVFRCHAADAEALSHVLPLAPDAERPSEARRALVRRMVSLPQRHFLLWVKDAVVPAHFVQARRVDAKRLRQEVQKLPDGFRKALGRWPENSPAARNPRATPTPTHRDFPFVRPSPELTSDADSSFPRLG
jgi:hypothetical protein